VWDFDVEQNSTPDLARQDVYEGCSPEDHISLVVAPGYVVDEKVYVKQLVFTDPPPPGPGTHPPSGDAAKGEASPPPPPANQAEKQTAPAGGPDPQTKPYQSGHKDGPDAHRRESR
jgi:hypothetical protein